MAESPTKIRKIIKLPVLGEGNLILQLKNDETFRKIYGRVVFIKREDAIILSPASDLVIIMLHRKGKRREYLIYKKGIWVLMR